MLKAEGFDIARRTVAKYREAIGLGSLGAAAAAEGDRAGGLTRRSLRFRIAAIAFGHAYEACCPVGDPPPHRLRDPRSAAARRPASMPACPQPMAACMAERMVDRLSLIQLRRIGDLPYAASSGSVSEFLHRVRSLGDPRSWRQLQRGGVCAVRDWSGSSRRLSLLIPSPATGRRFAQAFDGAVGSSLQERTACPRVRLDFVAFRDLCFRPRP